MINKETKAQKYQDHEHMEKCIFGMNLAKAQKKWVEENDSSNDQFAEYLYTSPRTKNRAIMGYVTSDNMALIAERLETDVLAMKEVSAHSIAELIMFRLTIDEHRRSALLGLAMIIFAFLAVFTNNIGPVLLLIISGDLFLHFAKNIWNVKVDATRNPDGSENKLMTFLDVMAVISALTLIVIICCVHV